MNAELIPSLAKLVLLFAAFSIAGWLMEVTLKYIQYHRFINRGFLIGPYCPIYGAGAVLITLMAGGILMRQGTPGETFLIGFVFCGALEYFISWYLEKTAHARWWDYSTKPMNLNGRIWIGNLILFGLAAVAIVYVADPPLFRLFDALSPTALYVTAGAFLVILISDYITSHFLMNIIRDTIDHQEADDTEEIKKEMHMMMKDRALLLRRIGMAYPNWQPRPNRLVSKFKAARAEYRKATHALKSELNSAERTLSRRRAQAEQNSAEARRTRVEQARVLQQKAREKLRTFETDVLHMEK